MTNIEFFNQYPDLYGFRIASSCLPEYRVDITFDTDDGIRLYARDKDKDEDEWHCMADQLDDVRCLCKLFSQGLSIQNLIDCGFLKPNKE
jgi:hypothetical protein